MKTVHYRLLAVLVGFVTPIFLAAVYVDNAASPRGSRCLSATTSFAFENAPFPSHLHTIGSGRLRAHVALNALDEPLYG